MLEAAKFIQGESLESYLFFALISQKSAELHLRVLPSRNCTTCMAILSKGSCFNAKKKAGENKLSS